MINRLIKILAVCLILVLMSSLVASCSPQSETNTDPDGTETYKWKVGVVDPEDYFMTQLTMEWGRLVEEKTGGQVEVEVFANGVLGGDREMMESLKTNTLQVWEGGVTCLSMFAPTGDLFTMPYLYQNSEHKYKSWDRYFTELTDEIAQQSGFRIVGVIFGTSRQLTSTRPIRTVEDLKGLKIRVPEVPPWVGYWRSVGANPVTMSFTEVFSALQMKAIDAQENDIALSFDTGFFEVCRYLTMIEYVSYDGLIMFAEDYWNDLPDNIKTAVSEASAYVQEKSKNVSRLEETDRLEKAMRERGVEVIYPKPEDMAQFVEPARSLVEQYPAIKDWYNKIQQLN